MTASIRSRILDHIEAQLGTIAGVMNVYRERQFDVPPDSVPAFNLTDKGNERVSDAEDVISTSYTMRVGVRMFGKPDTGEKLGDPIDRLYRALITAVLGDYSQGGLADDTHEDTLGALEPIQGPGAQPVAAQELDFLIDFRARQGDPTAAA